MATKKKAQKVYVSKLVVFGNGTFPMDMLRYDGCMPWSEADSVTIREPFLYGAKRRVELRRCCPNDRAAETRRWESFGWTVIEETSLSAWSS